nr:uncharacterized protein LOC108080576 [Drosophila kikkawai]
MDSSICLAILKAGVLDLLFNKLNNEKKSCSEQGVAELGSRNKSSKSEFVDIDSRKIPLEYWSVILPLCGTQVREINATWNIANKIPYRLILNECPYLESIQFNVNNNNWLEIISLLLEAKSLKSVYLHISKDCKVSVDILKVLRRLPKLTKLFLHGLDPKEVYQLQKLIHLEDLSLSLRKDSPPINIFEK